MMFWRGIHHETGEMLDRAFSITFGRETFKVLFADGAIMWTFAVEMTEEDS